MLLRLVQSVRPPSQKLNSHTHNQTSGSSLWKSGIKLCRSMEEEEQQQSAKLDASNVHGSQLTFSSAATFQTLWFGEDEGSYLHAQSRLRCKVDCLS